MKPLSLPMRLGLVAFLLVSLALPQVALAAPPPPPGSTPTPQGPTPADDQAVSAAVQQAMAGNVSVLAFKVFDMRVGPIDYSDDGQTALAWLVPYDKDTGQVIATEPGLAILRRPPQSPGAVAQSWGVTLQSDATWTAQLGSLPPELQQRVDKNLYLPPAEALGPQATQALGGYLLPWAKGQSKVLTQSIGHALIYQNCSTCLYAFDFADGTMFPVLAAKGGEVFYYYDGCPNNDHSCVNELILKDVTTSPTSYQIYYHLAQYSIPAEVKSVGRQVRQGQYVAIADNTGASTGHHLHFQVSTSLSGYWGQSVDVTFNDVSVNGGRPRTHQEAANYPQYGSQWVAGDAYTSGNQGTNPPTGDLTGPQAGLRVTDPVLSVPGWAADDRGITRLQIVANYDGNWYELASQSFSSPQKSIGFLPQVNLCTSGVPDGPVSLGLYVWDVEGNRSNTLLGLRNLYNDACHTPADTICTPNDNQVALYADPDFQGACKVLGSGNYPDASSLSPVADNDVASIQVGANVQAILYMDANYSLRPETFLSSDRNLADNRIEANTVSSVKVQAHQTKASAPLILWPPSDQALTAAGNSQYLAWEDAGGGTQFQAKLYQGKTWSGSPLKTLDWQAGTAWDLGSLPAGDYSWEVELRPAGSTDVNNTWSDWTRSTFTLTGTATVPAATQTAPFTDDMQNNNANGWSTYATGTGTAWGLADTSQTHAGSTAWWLGANAGGTYHDVRNAGLTSPRIALPAGGSYFLRFKYFAQTEADTIFWDQRLVQIAVDGGEFNTLSQLSDDQPSTWRSQDWHTATLDLSAYAGHSVRVRFEFLSGDIPGVHTLNDFEGWYIDDFSIDSTPPATTPCAGSDAGNDPAHAAQIDFNTPISGVICPNNDLDFYKFNGSAGDYVTLNIDAQSLSPASGLDSIVKLFDQDGVTLLAENDDQADGQRNSLVRFSLPQSGVYYVEVKDYFYPGDHPADDQVSAARNYNLILTHASGSNRPSVSLTNPPSGGYIGASTLIQASAAGGLNGVSRVEFFYHSSDWEGGQWVSAGTDTDGSDGWQVWFNPQSLPNSTCKSDSLCPAIFVRAFDEAGNWAGDVAWNLNVDRTLPTSAMQALPATVYSGAFLLQWGGSDDQSGLAGFDIQYQDNGGAWQTWDTHPNGDARQAWFIGAAGHTYRFRMRAVDRAGNAEAFPSSAETSTTIAGACSNDAFEEDGSQANASSLALGASQAHVFCSGDVDWVKFTPQAGHEYLVWAVPTGSGAAAPQMVLYRSDGVTEVAHVTPGPVAGAAVLMKWVAPDSGPYYLKLSPVDGRVVGSAVTYVVRVGDGHYLTLPLVGR